MIEQGDKVKLFDRAKNVVYTWRKFTAKRQQWWWQSTNQDSGISQYTMYVKDRLKKKLQHKNMTHTVDNKLKQYFVSYSKIWIAKKQCIHLKYHQVKSFLYWILWSSLKLNWGGGVVNFLFLAKFWKTTNKGSNWLHTCKLKIL